MLAKEYYKFNTKSDTLHISKEARDHNAIDKDIINATIGALYDECHNFYEYNSVKKAIQSISTAYPYTSIEGDLEIVEKWLKHLFNQDLPKNYEAIVTNGGTGALSLGLDAYLEPGDIVISGVPDWTNNKYLIEHGKHKYVSFPIFNESGIYNIESLDTLLNIYQNQKVMILINDPAQNPTGYTMDRDTWNKVFNCINKYNKNRNILLMIDLAYIDYASKKTTVMELIRGYNQHVMTLLAISGSKTFSLYGARVGFLVALSHKIDELSAFKEATKFAARSTYSLPSSFGIKVLKKLFTKYETFAKELQHANHMLKLRRNLFKKVLDQKNIPYYPNHDGFFVTIISKNPYLLYEKLKAKKIYTIPVINGVRIAISSISLDQIEAMRNRI
jgi:aspartate/tyrosine/aromatic aminotransferase